MLAWAVCGFGAGSEHWCGVMVESSACGCEFGAVGLRLYAGGEACGIADVSVRARPACEFGAGSDLRCGVGVVLSKCGCKFGAAWSGQ